MSGPENRKLLAAAAFGTPGILSTAWLAKVLYDKPDLRKLLCAILSSYVPLP